MLLASSQSETPTTSTPKRIDNDLLLVDELLWRMYPHTFAERTALRSPGGPFKITRLAAYLGETIADAVAEGDARIIVNVAPRQGKSEVCSFAAPCWFLDNFPDRRVIVASHTADLALDYGRRCRNEFADNPALTARLAEDSKAANRWNTPEGGGMKTIGVGGALPGFGGHLTIVDDPHKGWTEAQSPTQRRRVTEWFDGTLMRRLEPGGSVVVVMQRWHRDDLTGYLLNQPHGRWKVVRLPALASPGDPMGRQEGEPVCPERYDARAMERMRESMPAVVWGTSYQQDPTALGDGRTYGHFIAAEHVKTAETELRLDLPMQLAWDFNINPGVHCEIGQYDRGRDLFTTRHEVFGERHNTPRTLVLLKARLDAMGAFDAEGKFRFSHVEVYGDRSGKSGQTASSNTDYDLIMRALSSWGCNPAMMVQTANPAIRDRVLSVNDALRDPAGDVHWLIHPECKRLIRDLEDVREDEEGLPDKQSDSDLTHPSDAEGYRVFRLRPVNAIDFARLFGGAGGVSVG